MKQRLPLLALLVIFITLLSMNSLTAQKTDSQTAPKTYLALGDSYTIGESVAESERWPIQLAARLVHEGVPMKDPKIIAKTGWRTDDLKSAIEADNELLESYDLVSLLIGVNNQYQGKSVESFAPEFEELLQIAIKYAGGKKENVFVVSIPDYGKTPFGAAKEEQIKKELDAYNKVSKNIAKKYGVAYYNITPISRMAKSHPELIANDDLHPSGKMYTKWVELFEKKVEKMLKK
ncbi:lysophospholipase [Roseivirga seohaensis subsp. aquiponti]|uniref:Lysophospholipase n=1 Tax=Roseivirga seohaensis subsp. aquiponti TaxID=1566026 RepID=A0A0L8AIZ1_9BACT|nr:SGNH/GDSL hydrolase family protein [Roseivirga seohaensis]KOF02110.1 lysophospholipase [Roseivirga seohaensis subsp. aquiponti]